MTRMLNRLVDDEEREATKRDRAKASSILRINVYVINGRDDVIREHIGIDINSRRKQVWLIGHILWAILNHHSVEIISQVDDK